MAHALQQRILLPPCNVANHSREIHVSVHALAFREGNGKGFASKRPTELAHVPNQSRHQVEEAGNSHGEAVVIENPVVSVIGVADNDGARECGQVGQRDPR